MFGRPCPTERVGNNEVGFCFRPPMESCKRLIDQSPSRLRRTFALIRAGLFLFRLKHDDAHARKCDQNTGHIPVGRAYSINDP